jgi:murein DD-endopeptidase MepM/ murein hydrolase activator NlpD
MRHAIRQRTPRKGFPLIRIVLAVALVAAAIYFAPNFEWKAPSVDVALRGDSIGLAPFDVVVADQGKGLKSVDVVLSTKGGELSLAHEDVPPGNAARTVTITPEPKALAAHEGEAVMRVTAVDRSLWGFLQGNKTVVERKVTVDVTPPRLEVLSRNHYVNFGGSGFAIYKAAPDTVRSGIAIGDHFFPGVKGQLPDPDAYVVVFAHPYDTAKDARPLVIAEDAAGNRAQAGIHYVLKNRDYRQRTLQISDNFIDRVVMRLLPGGGQGMDRAEAFLKVNNQMRKQNAERIAEICSHSADKPLWHGAFAQLSNSKVEASFADERTYVYNGKPVDRQYHLGYDLAVTKRYPVEAANSGIVAFADRLGIYGNTVIIDHGLGVSTLYAHLSSIEVKAGDRVEKKTIVGRSGATGLAGGDHLHYGVFVRGVPVLPVEWWDPHWMHDNIDLKLEEARQDLGGQSAAG